MNCTTIDHVYPILSDDGRPSDGTPCFCGARRWNQDGSNYTGPLNAPARARRFPPRKGSRVELRRAPGIVRRVIEIDREAAMVRVDGLDEWFEREDLV